jgi:hypothetical protein
MKRQFLLPGLLMAAVLALAGCTSEIAGSASPAPAPMAPVAAPAKVTSSAEADRKVCVDLDARGGALYSVFVVPMMAGAVGKKSINVDIQQMVRAVDTLTKMDEDEIDKASANVKDQGQRLLAAAEAFQAYNNAEGTALLTAMVGTAGACQIAGLKPSWFDANKLAGK